MAYTKGTPKPAGSGRAKGSKNKSTKAIKDMIEGALSAVGGQKYLERQAEENPVAFMGLVGKILPREIKGELTATITGLVKIPTKNDITDNLGSDD